MGQKGSIIGNTALIVVGLDSTLMRLKEMPESIRKGIIDGFKVLVKNLAEKVKDQMVPGVQLYWTGALRESVKGFVSGRAGILGGNITAMVTAGDSRVWYAYKVHELGRGWGSHSWSRSRMWGSSKKKYEYSVSSVSYTYPPIPYMRIAYQSEKKNIVKTMVNNIQGELNQLMIKQALLQLVALNSAIKQELSGFIA